MKLNPIAINDLPHSWSELTWQQLCDCWQVKLRYGGNADIARAAAFVALLKFKIENSKSKIKYDEQTGERIFFLRNSENPLFRYSVTARELAWMARKALPWFDYPYGDAGQKEEKDDKGNIIKERREAVKGYVSNMKDAMVLPLEQFSMFNAEGVASCKRERSGNVQWSMFNVQCSMFNKRWFQLPQAAGANLTWEQYRTLQNITPQLFSEGNTDTQAIELQAQFLAHILTPRSFALFDTTGGNIKIRPHYVYQYNSEQAEKLVPFWKKALTRNGSGHGTLFHICFQVYQTALTYYSEFYPLLFGGGGKQDPLKDALTGEVGTINTIMKYQGYSDPQAVYDANLPIILDVLNTMTKEAKEIEKMNAKIKRK